MLKIFQRKSSKSGFEKLPWAPDVVLTARDIKTLKALLANQDEMFVITDTQKPDHEIVYASKKFIDYTGYDESEIVNHNCRFLQGQDTRKEDVDKIRHAIKEGQDASVFLKNYKKDGSAFYNQFYISPIREKKSNKIRYFVGVQCMVKDEEDQGQDKNVLYRLRKE